MNIEIGSRVEKIARDYTKGRTGEVIEIKGGRARVRWDIHRLINEVNLKVLKVIDESDQIIVRSNWVRALDMKENEVMRICKNTKTGDVWHEHKVSENHRWKSGGMR